MPSGELFLGAFLGGLFNVLLDRLTSPELVRFLRQEGFETKINKWGRTLEIINALLGDAEEKQLTDRAVKIWLDDLEDLAYDAEDMLDEFEYEATARKIKMDQLQGSSAFWKHVSAGLYDLSPEIVSFRLRMWSKVNDVNTRFDQLCKLRQDLGLQAITGGASSTSSRSSAAPRRTPTSSLPTGAVYGRGADQDKILEMVLKNEPNDSNILVIPIVGMGGVGKTTLARVVYNHHKVVESFEVKAWVCVSDCGFDVTRISMSILADITGSALEKKNFNTVHTELKQNIDGKRFLLVLDDLWSINPDDWETFRSPFLGSAWGSRIIVTTRHEQVASTFTLKSFHSLGVISDEDCWSVFRTCIDEKMEAVVESPDFPKVRKNVIEKCRGLPLAAKALGGLLRSKQIDDWLKTLNSSLWNLLEKERPEIPTAVKLSYYHLPSYLRRCFAYCSIFPKDYEFEIEEVVFLWIADGLVQQSTENKQLDLEELGRDYFNDLLGRSMFQQSRGDNAHKFIMHDLVHDLAKWAFGERSLCSDGALAAKGQRGGSDKVRYFSYTSGAYDDEKRFEVFQEVETYLKARIRTFLPIPQVDYHRYVANSVLFDLLSNLKRLRILSLQSYIIVKIPIPIGDLKHLKYLNLSRTLIRSLPESTSLLYNLQILMLRYCYRLEKLPSNFKYLIKLFHLDIKGAISIKEMPLGMKDLRNLEKLSNFIVGKGVGSSLKDLTSLTKLRGKLCIQELDNVIDCDHNDPILRDKKDIKELLLEWGNHFHESPSEATKEMAMDMLQSHEKVLDILQPHENLQELTITRYAGTKFPPWVGAASYSNMKVLRLENCKKCTCLPSLGVLASLEELTIKEMKGITHIGFEFYGNCHSKPFKSLKRLCFEDLLVWADWEPIEKNKYGGAFPCLHQLSIKKCPQLSGSLPTHLSALEELIIENCEQLVVFFSKIPELCKIKIDGCKRIACDNPVDFESIRYLQLSNISEFSNQLLQECFGKAQLQQIKHNRSDDICPQKPPLGGLQSIRFLTELVISNCPNIVSFPEVCSLPHLSKLEIHDCNALISLPEEMKIKNACLESLKIWRCDSLAFIVRGPLPLSLKWLEIKRCEKLESLWDDREGSCSSRQGKENGDNTNSSLLEYLTVWSCPSLTSLSSTIQLPPTLKHLELNGCAQLTTIAEGFLDSNMSLEVLVISDCANLVQIPSGLNNLRHLRQLSIASCPSIECFPEEGLADTNLRKLEIRSCEKLKAIPSLNSLEDLIISSCPSITSFNPEEEFSTNLKSLKIKECMNVYRPLVKWGLQNLTSLTSLELCICPDVKSFPQQEIKMMLPPSLIYLRIVSFAHLEQFWSQGLQNLTALQQLDIVYCPRLTSLGDQGLPSSLELLFISCCPNLPCFPQQGLPSSLQCLEIKFCPQLEKECKRNNGREWSKISSILEVAINGVEIFDLEEDEEPQSSSWCRSCLTNPMQCCKSTQEDTLDGSSTIDNLVEGSIE